MICCLLEGNETMYTAYLFSFGTIEIEYHGNVLYKLRCTPRQMEMTHEIVHKHSSYSDDIFNQVEEFLAGKRTDFRITYQLNGTQFQKNVWNALLDIPYGKTKTYKEIAQAIGCPGASRAVGMANNRNPLMLIIPCHRVIGCNSSLVGYVGGLEMKKTLLAVEQSKNIIVDFKDDFPNFGQMSLK